MDKPEQCNQCDKPATCYLGLGNAKLCEDCYAKFINKIASPIPTIITVGIFLTAFLILIYKSK